jgi:FkbM family methyltransferase
MWRIGRYLYCRARGDVDNSIETNGEAYIQACVLKGTSVANMPLMILDVGANLGEWTKCFLRQTSDERISSLQILMFEPVSVTYEKLMRNISQIENGCVAKAFPLAMSNESGLAEMLILSETGGTNSLDFDSTLAAAAIGRTQIEKVTIDDFCTTEAIEHIHLLKFDTEGHDAHALLGAREMLKDSCLDVVQFEYNHRWIHARSYLKDVFDLVEGLPYNIGRICPDHIEIFKTWHFELDRFFEGNYIIVNDSALDWFDVHEGHFDASNTYA